MAPTPQVSGGAACVGGWGRQGCQAGPAHQSFPATQNPRAGGRWGLEGLGVDSQSGRSQGGGGVSPCITLLRFYKGKKN